MLQCKTKWKKKKLENLSEMQKGKLTALGMSCNKNWIKLLNTETLFSNIETYADTKNAVISTYKDVLILCDGERSGLVAKGRYGVVGSTFAKLSVDNSEIDTDYLYHFLNNKFVWIQNRRTGTGIPHIPKDLSRILKISYPADIAEQAKIADILSTCDKVIEKTEETIEIYKQIKAGMMQDLFTRGIDKNGKLRPTYEQASDLYKYSEELNRYIPKEWEVKRLDEISIILSGKDYKGNPKGNCKIPIYGTGGIMGYTTISLYSGPAVLTGRKGSINNPYYVEGDFWNVDTIFCLKMLDDNDALWFYYQIYITDMTKYNEATGVPSTTSKTLNKILFAVPESSEQIKIAKYITKFDLKINTEAQYLNKYKQIKQGLMKRLLTPPADAEIVEEYYG